MLVELRRNGQVIVPKRIAYELGLEEGDRLVAFSEGGMVHFARPELGSIREPENDHHSMRGANMYVELRRNLQVIIPRQIANDLNLEVGDMFDVVEEDGVIKLIPVVVYTKAEAERLERLAREGHTPGHASGSSLSSSEPVPAPASDAAPGASEYPEEQ